MSGEAAGPHIDDEGGSSDGELARALESYLSAAEAGRPIDPDRLAAEHPAIADELRSCLEVLRLADRVEQEAGEGSDAGGAEDSEPIPTLGDFRILRQVGRGGMGVVYEAEQVSLHRRVALKVLPFASALDPLQLRRFQTEALAAAQLHHTNIVPVYSVGCERGVHYYAMQYIEGQTLAALVRDLRRLSGLEPSTCRASTIGPSLAEEVASGRLAPEPAGLPGDGTPSGGGQDRAGSSARARMPKGPTGGQPPSAPTPSPDGARTRGYFRTVANLGMQAAEALEHAHTLGIVHRDVKPANLLVDSRGNLWITDFGLARILADSGLTMTGDVIGTLRYMSPEQAMARRAIVDHRSDIYSLGVTLYELLALRPAFDGEGREALLRQIVLEEPRPPRRCNPAVPVDLETIVLKAMAKDPVERYATARELVEDLRRFLELKPIRARRPTLFERAAKWSRRNSALVMSAVVMLCLTAIGLAISTATIVAQQAEAVRQRDEAHRQEERARRILDELYTGLSERWLAQDPGEAELRREFLEKVAAYYEEFGQVPGRTPEFRLEAAHAWLRVGLICWTLRRLPEGEAAYRQAIERFAGLAAEGRVDVLEARDGEAYAAYRLGDLLTVAGREAEAAACHNRSIGLCRAELARHPDRLAARINLAAAQSSLGGLRRDPASLRQAVATYREIIADVEADRVDVGPLVEQFTKHRIVVDTPFPGVAATVTSRGEARQVILAGLHFTLGIALEYQGRLSETEDCYRRSLAALSSPARGNASRDRHPRSLVLRIYAGTLGDLGRYQEAVQAYRDALTLVPNESKVHEGLAVLLANCPDPAIRDPREAIRLARRGIDLRPDDGHIWQALGMGHYRAGEWPQALAALERAGSLRSGGEVRDKLFLAMTHWRLGHREEARRWYTRGLEQAGRPGGREAGTAADAQLELLRTEAAALLQMTDERPAAKDARSSRASGGPRPGS